MSMNWNDLLQQASDGGTYEALPDGQYHVKVTSAEAKNSTTGKPMIVTKFQVLAGPFAGRLVWNNFVITQDNPNALSWFFKNMGVMGLDHNFFAMNPSLEATAAALIDKQCMVTLTQKTWNNEVRNEVKSIASAVGNAMHTAAPVAPAPAAAPAPAPAPVAEPAPTTTAAEAAAPNVQPPSVPF